MKVEELIQDETKVTGLLQKTEWLNDGPSVALAEDVMYALWKLDRKHALELWEKHVPYAMSGVTPGFIVHRAIEEGLDYE